jgi:hypothetical protein
MSITALADDAEGEPGRTTAPYQRGDLAPVKVIRVDLRQRRGDAETPELGRSPVVHVRLARLDRLVTGVVVRRRFHRSVPHLVITIRASAIPSSGDAYTSAPALASGAVAWDDPLHTVVRNRAVIGLRAMAELMMPVPSTATTSPVIDFLPSGNEHYRALGPADARLTEARA